MGVGTDHTFKETCLLKHKSYTREYKLEVIRHFHKVERNAYATAKKFNISRAVVKDWFKKETTIQVFFWLLCKVMALKLMPLHLISSRHQRNYHGKLAMVWGVIFEGVL